MLDPDPRKAADWLYNATVLPMIEAQSRENTSRRLFYLTPWVEGLKPL